MPGSPAHLVRRFFGVLTASPLSAEELDDVRSWLSHSEFELFASQSVPDQRHGYEAGTFVVESGVSDADVIAAGALHDIGKRHSGLGVVGRSVASLMIITRTSRLWGRAATYRDHSDIGALELSSAGSSDLVVEFARHHHGTRPKLIDEATWTILKRADAPPKARLPRRPPIT